MSKFLAILKKKLQTNIMDGEVLVTSAKPFQKQSLHCLQELLLLPQDEGSYTIGGRDREEKISPNIKLNIISCLMRSCL